MTANDPLVVTNRQLHLAEQGSSTHALRPSRLLRLVPFGRPIARSGGLVARVRPPASPAKTFILREKGRAAPSPPQRQSAGPWLGCGCARTTPANSRCPPRPRLFATTAGPMAEAIALRR
jgi:hypothetical protein